MTTLSTDTLPRLTVAELRDALPRPEIERLRSGLTLCVLPSARAPVVASALWYRAGTRDEAPGHGGTAHFLEHMMFKGSRRFGPGEVDRLTRGLGGSNNAFTSHDATEYHFVFAADRWRRALELEGDRMAGLRLDPEEVERERQVILEEVAMYEGEPWDALEQAVATALHGDHAYGRPVLGSREDLAAIDAAVLADFHRRRYRPENAVLVVAGDVRGDVVADVERWFVPREPLADDEADRMPSRGAGERPASGELRRLERRHGEVPRLLLAVPGPAADHPDHAALRLLSAVLAGGRSSRLHRRLVDDGQLAVWVDAGIGETVEPGALSVAVEVVPDEDPERVEAEVLDELAALRREPPSEAEIGRARRILAADWVFGHEKAHQLALTLGSALTLWDAEHPWRGLERLLGASRDDLLAAAGRWLDPAGRGGVLGWSLPHDDADDDEDENDEQGAAE